MDFDISGCSKFRIRHVNHSLLPEQGTELRQMASYLRCSGKTREARSGVKVPRPIKLLGIGAGSVFLVVVVFGYLLAVSLYLAQAVFWGNLTTKISRSSPVARSTTRPPPCASTN